MTESHMSTRKKLIFVDIDGTIFMKDQGVSPALAESFDRVRANGHRLFLATGRAWNSLPEEVMALEWDGIISSAGSDIHIYGKRVFQTSLDRALIREIVDVMKKIPGMIYMLEGFDRTFVGGSDSSLFWEKRSMPDWMKSLREEKNTRSLDVWSPEREEIPKVSFMVDSPEVIEQIRCEFGELLHVVSYPIYQNPDIFYGELISREADKGAGIVKATDWFGMDLADTIAFGDSMNDYSMIERAGVGIAMGNADPGLKEIADHVCESVWDNGVLLELEQRGLA
ncbi:MAG: HAD family hydrolase [Lachnospiraceae bacterium]|nr:HAD family hydrolase [Lachnospiraceae bacterium]